MFLITKGLCTENEYKPQTYKYNTFKYSWTFKQTSCTTTYATTKILCLGENERKMMEYQEALKMFFFEIFA